MNSRLDVSVECLSLKEWGNDSAKKITYTILSSMEICIQASKGTHAHRSYYLISFEKLDPRFWKSTWFSQKNIVADSWFEGKRGGGKREIFDTSDVCAMQKDEKKWGLRPQITNWLVTAVFLYQNFNRLYKTENNDF